MQAKLMSELKSELRADLTILSEKIVTIESKEHKIHLLGDFLEKIETKNNQKFVIGSLFNPDRNQMTTLELAINQSSGRCSTKQIIK